MAVTYSGLRMIESQPASRVSPWYQSRGLTRDADSSVWGKQELEVDEWGAAASLAKNGFGGNERQLDRKQQGAPVVAFTC